jgi:hypothetical protein
VLVIEAFASRYQVARQLCLVNTDAAHTGLQVSAYAAVELDATLHSQSPNGAVIGVGRDRYVNIHGSFKDAAAQGQLLGFVQRMLQQSADGSGQRIDCIVVFASPAADAACEVYSTASLGSIGLEVDDTGRLQQPQNEQQQAMVRQLQQQLYEADRHVSSVLEMYRMIQALCAAADAAAQPGHGSTIGSTVGGAADSPDAVQALQPTLTRLVMVGPWNEEQLLLPMTTSKLEASRLRAAAAARQRKGLQRAPPGTGIISYTSAADTADDESESGMHDASATASGAESDIAAESTAGAAALQDDAGAMEVVPLGLHRRPFLEPQLAGSLTGGDLLVSKQPWCMYGELKGDLPPLAVISDMQPGLPDGGCICSACGAAEEYQDEADADTAAASGDAGLQERQVQPVWPEALVLTLMRMLQAQVAAERAAAAQRTRDSAAAAAAAAGPAGRGATRASTAAAKKRDIATSSSGGGSGNRSAALASPAPGTTEEERRQQLMQFTVPALAGFARGECGLTIKTKTKKSDLIGKIIEHETAKGRLVAAGMVETSKADVVPAEHVAAAS